MLVPLDLDALDDLDPVEFDTQSAHLFKHGPLGTSDVLDAWESDPLFYPAKPPAHWLMVAELAGRVITVPLARPDRATRRNAGRSGVTRHQHTWPGSIGETEMTTESMTPDEEYAFYADPRNQEPQGKPRRRRPRLTDPVPVRFAPDVLDEVKRRAEADDRSVSSWIRRAVEQELRRPA